MRGDQQLFDFIDDLEAQAEAAYDAERRAELEDRSRAEYAEVTLAARITASVGRELDLDVRGVGLVSGELVRVGADWLRLRTPRQDWVVRHAAVARVVAASPRAVPEAAWSPLQRRLGISSVLRRLADDGSRCLLHSLDGRRHDVVIRRVGRDFVEVQEGETRESLVALDALAAVQSPDPEL